MNVVYVIIAAMFFALGRWIPIQRATCPPGMWLDEGIRDDGNFRCTTITKEHPKQNVRGGWYDDGHEPTFSIYGKVTCAKPRAYTDDSVTVRCPR